MSTTNLDASFNFWAVTIPKNSKKLLKMESDRSVYHLSNATLGKNVVEGRTTLYLNANGRKAPICNLVNNTLENATLDFIVPRSMNASFVVQGPNTVTVSGYVQPPVEDIGCDELQSMVDNSTFKVNDSIKVQAFETKTPEKLAEEAILQKKKLMEDNYVTTTVQKEDMVIKAKLAEKNNEEISVKSGQKKVICDESLLEEEMPGKNMSRGEKPGQINLDLRKKDWNSKKRKFDIAEQVDEIKPSKKKPKKKKKKKQKVSDASVSPTNGSKSMISEKTEESKELPEVNRNDCKKDAHITREKTKPKETVETVKPSQVAMKKDSTKKESSKLHKKKKKFIEASHGVKYRVLKKGMEGVNPAKTGDMITLLYVGCLKDGRKFDNNLKEGLTFKIGGEEAIPGIEIGVLGMCPNEKRRIIVPPEQAYGDAGAGEGAIPPNAELHFTVQRKA